MACARNCILGRSKERASPSVWTRRFSHSFERLSPRLSWRSAATSLQRREEGGGYKKGRSNFVAQVGVYYCRHNTTKRRESGPAILRSILEQRLLKVLTPPPPSSTCCRLLYSAFLNQRGGWKRRSAPKGYLLSPFVFKDSKLRKRKGSHRSQGKPDLV